MSAVLGQFLHFTLSLLGKAPQRFMLLTSVPFLFVHMAHSLIHDPFGFPLQLPSFLVPAFSGQFLDFSRPFLRPELEALFAVMLAVASLGVGAFPVVFTIAFPVLVMCSVRFPTTRFLCPNPPKLMAQFFGFLVFALLLEFLDMVALLVDPFAQLAFVLFGIFTIAFPSFSFFRDEEVGGYDGKQYAEECVCFLHGDGGGLGVWLKWNVY